MKPLEADPAEMLQLTDNYARRHTDIDGEMQDRPLVQREVVQLGAIRGGNEGIRSELIRFLFLSLVLVAESFQEHALRPVEE